MKKPEITKKMLPLLDILFLLLAFFIILPHGITSNEKVKIKALEKENESRSRSIDYYEWKLDYYEWKFSKKKSEQDNVFKTMTLQVQSDELYHESKKIEPDQWKEYLQQQFQEQHVNFIFVKIIDIPGNPTLSGTVQQLENLLDELKVIHIIQI